MLKPCRARVLLALVLIAGTSAAVVALASARTVEAAARQTSIRCYHDGRRTGCPRGGAPCRIDTRRAGRLLGFAVRSTGAENMEFGKRGVRFWYCYYQGHYPAVVGSGRLELNLRVGLLHCADLDKYFDSYLRGPSRRIRVGRRVGLLKYDRHAGSAGRSGLALAVLGSVGARVDFENFQDRHPPFATRRTVEQLAMQSLEAFSKRFGQTAPPRGFRCY